MFNKSGNRFRISVIEKDLNIPLKKNGCTPGPFLRWAGGKQWIAPIIASIVPHNLGNYFEPFLGGGSVFLSVKPERAILGDLNSRLVETYTEIRDNPEAVIYWLSKWENSKDIFLKLRNTTFSIVSKRAAQFIYLNKTCWNGLYRVNKIGQFNVPYGNSPNRHTHDPKSIMYASQVLIGAVLKSCDFEDLLLNASSGDFAYLDPPYTVLHSENGFRRYNEHLFCWDDQQRLASIAHLLVSRGCFVAISNANHSDILKLYPRFYRYFLVRRSNLSANPKFRRSIQEVLLISPNLAKFL
jgi:DNA adenine methylase